MRLFRKVGISCFMRRAGWLSVAFGLAVITSSDALGETHDAFVWNKDVVCMGTIARMDTLVRFVGPDSVPIPVVDYRLTVSQVYQGTVEDSSIAFSCSRNIVFPVGECRVGRRVLFWGDRLFSEAWRLWGSFAIVRTSGELLSSMMSNWFADLDHPSLEGVLGRAPAGRPGSLEDLLAGSTAIGLGRVTKIEVSNKPVVTVTIDSVGWAWGSAPSIPRRLRYNSREDCIVGYTIGDTLLVPARPTATSSESLLGCPRPLRTKQGYVPGLDVPLASLGRALRFQQGAFTQARVLPRE